MTSNTFNSTADTRTINNATPPSSSNVMRHNYRILNDEEKAQMQALKDKGLEFYNLLESIGTSRELSIAKTKVEEAVMWGVKSLTR